jgi:hypothetical protein
VTWYTNGNGTRFTGIELFDRNMNFQRQLAHAGGHMDITRDVNGDEVLAWAGGGDPWPQTNCAAGVVKIRLSDGQQTCIWRADWSMALHVSAPDNSGWVFVENYVPSDPIPPTGWVAYTNEIIQVKLDGSEVRRLAHHRSRPLNSYEYQPKTSVSRDGAKVVFTSNFNLQAILGYPSGYGDTYMMDLAGTAPITAPPPTITRIEQNGTGVTYSGTWSDNSGAFNSGGSAKLSMDTNSTVTLVFNGSSASWIAYRDEWSGIAQVYVDGTLRSEVDTYASPNKAQASMYTISGLTNGAHTLSIVATGRKNASSGGAWVWVDAFDVSSGDGTAPPPPTPTGTLYRIEQSNAAVKWSGTWSVNNGKVNSGGSAKLAMDAASRATFTFTGTSVSWSSGRCLHDFQPSMGRSYNRHRGDRNEELRFQRSLGLGRCVRLRRRAAYELKAIGWNSLPSGGLSNPVPRFCRLSICQRLSLLRSAL